MSLGITVWAARKTRTTDQFYAAGRSVTALQNGLALAGGSDSVSSVFRQTILQSATPDDMRGRVYATWNGVITLAGLAVFWTALALAGMLTDSNSILFERLAA